MRTREIRTPATDGAVVCDVCGRTLLRGERAHPFREGPEPRTVCELCTGRAHREGWVREGAAPAAQGPGESGSRRRSLLERLRSRRRASPLAAIEAGDAATVPARRAPGSPRRRLREPRHVRAVPSSAAQRRAAAVNAFNASEHPRTIAGVARSLGLPAVAVWQGSRHPAVLHVTVAWELSWYRFQVDLAAQADPVRLVAQGSELDELADVERQPNATCDGQGMLALAAGAGDRDAGARES